VQVVVIDRRFFQQCEAQGLCRLIEAALVRTSFTLVGNELDLVGEISV
jgi:hypothetical protein